ncbi:MAG: DUF6048 family protein [Cyclobacteriaceae bacterium]|nr:hypothetical protein [Cyclobacteriaceae bacterium]MCH8515714.1 DUF6048 family protein [Cyclobacteriaceae bacterium]
MKFSFSIFSVCLLTFGLIADLKAQTERYLPSGVRVGIDALNLGYGTFNPRWQRYEVHGDIDIDKYLLSLDLGTHTFNETSEVDQLNYNMSGSFFRVGIDYNVLYLDSAMNAFFVGLRHGRAAFSENLRSNFPHPIFGDVVTDASNPSVNGSWWEMAFGFKAQVYKNIYMGYTLSMRIFPSASGQTEMGTYWVPGLGRVEEGINFGFNYHIMYRIPFRQKYFHIPEPDIRP